MFLFPILACPTRQDQARGRESTHTERAQVGRYLRSPRSLPVRDVTGGTGANGAQVQRETCVVSRRWTEEKRHLRGTVMAGLLFMRRMQGASGLWAIEWRSRRRASNPEGT